MAATKRAIDRAGNNVLLVGHSWGGTDISEAGNDPRVKGLVYIAALVPDQGETLTSLTTKAPTQLNSYLENRIGFLTVTRPGVSNVFAGDLPKKQQDLIFATQTPAAQINFDTPISTPPAWKSKPNWFIVASQDNVINPELERFLAKRANARTTELSFSHLAMISKPRQVAKVIEEAAASIR